MLSYTAICSVAVRRRACAHSEQYVHRLRVSTLGPVHPVRSDDTHADDVQ